MWTYATCGMSQPTDSNPVELHLFSPTRTDAHVELLTSIAHYHVHGQIIGLGHTVNFGRPWIPGSNCDYGLISRPYLDGPALEEFRSSAFENLVQCLWLLPITKAERDYKRVHGLEALEQKFEKLRVNYVDPKRPSIV